MRDDGVEWQPAHPVTDSKHPDHDRLLHAPLRPTEVSCEHCGRPLQQAVFQTNRFVWQHYDGTTTCSRTITTPAAPFDGHAADRQARAAFRERMAVVDDLYPADA